MIRKRLDTKQKTDILVIDDTTANRKLLLELLCNEGYSVQEAVNGTSALELLASTDVSLILLDVIMPGMNGFALCRELKKNDHTRNIPVIFISAVDSHESRIDGFKAGGVDFITKPIQPEEVLARIKAQINLFQLQKEMIEKNKRLEKEITIREKTEKALFESELFFKQSQKAANIGSYKLDTQNGTWITSDVLKNIFGFGLTDIFTLSDWEDSLHPSDRGSICRYFKEEVMEKGNPFNKEYRIIRKNDGAIRWVYEFGSIYHDPQSNSNYLIGTIQDISERKEALETIHNERTLLRTLIDHLPDAIYVKDKEGRKVVANQFDIENIGFSSEKEVLGKTDLELFPGNIGERGYDDDMNVIRNGIEVINREEYFYAKNGELLWLQTTKLPLRNHKDEIIGLVGIGRDITQNKKATDIIEHERKLLRTLIDNLPFAIYVKDRDARKLIANSADLKLMGCSSEEEVIGKTDLELFNSQDGLNGYNEDLSVIRTGMPLLNKENSYIDTEGRECWRVISKIPLFDRHGNTTGLVGFGRDITEQKTANDTILKLSKAIEQSPSAIIITDIEGTIEYANPKFCEISGYQTDEVIGQNPRILKSGETPPEKYKEMWVTILSGGIWRGELHNRKKNGELYWEWATIASIKNEKGITTNFISINEDINSKKQMETELFKAKEKAEENDRLKSAFLANMSHEIRTPLNCILGFAELLTDPDAEAGQRAEYAQLIETSGNNLLSIINDILDISKIEAGQVEVKKTVFSAKKMIQIIHKEFEWKAAEKGVQLRLGPTLPDNDLLVESDEIKIRQVLTNFIGNALKFTDKGYIEIGCKIARHEIQFYVTDTGIGIPEKYQKHLFDRFRQVETTPTRKYGGNGLGLAISKNLIELLGGTIGVESEPEKGSTFFFTLPF